MKLKTAERLNLLSILPAEADFATLKIKRDLEADLSLTEKENKDWEVNMVAGKNGIGFYNWNDKGKNALVEVKIGEKAMDMIVDALKKLNKEKKLTDNLFEIYERFVNSK